MAQGKIYLRKIDQVKDETLTKISIAIKNVEGAIANFDIKSSHNLRAAITLLKHEEDKLKNYIP